MAKQSDIQVDAFEPFAVAAARIVRRRADELFENEEGVLDTSDIERVHDMRVASRRLRAVLEIFAPCFPQGDYKTVLRDVKALADALVARLRQRQARGNDTLAAALEDVRESELHARLHSLCDGALEAIA